MIHKVINKDKMIVRRCLNHNQGKHLKLIA